MVKNIIILLSLIFAFLGCTQQPEKPNLPPHLTKMISEGSGTSLHKVGNAYETGDGVPMNIVEAARWYFQAASKGNVNSHYAIWRLWEDFSKPNMEPPFPPGQFEKSRRLAIAGYEKILNENNDAEIYYRLGLLYDPGIGIGGEEERQSKRYLKIAADMGHEEAKELLAFIKDYESRSK